MLSAAQQIRPSLQIRSDSSGTHNSGWIGYNLENMQYFFFIYTLEPDVVYFETYKRLVSTELPIDSPAKIYRNDCDSDMKWSMSVELTEHNYFGKNSSHQNSTLVQFLEDSLARVVKETQPFSVEA